MDPMTFSLDATPLRENGYKVTLARELVRRALRSLVAV